MSNQNFLKRVSTLLVMLTLTTIALYAQSFEERVNFGALLEPSNGVIHAAGQSSIAFENYWETMDDGEKPMGYLFYIGLNSVNEYWYVPLKQELLQRKDVLIIPQIGLSMTNDGMPEDHYEKDVANGDYDEQIDLLIEGLRHLGSPAYIRIGYEFNGVTWNGYDPETYKEAFKRIATKIKEADIEIATVWCAAIDGATNYFDYYPGDEFVDWFAVDTFEKSHFSNSNTGRFLDSASVHKKPVMIGESTPRGTGSKDGQVSWDNWYADYFKFIKENPEIKFTSYINWNWAEYPQWSTWGDARIEDSGIVKTLYNGEKDSSMYIHAQSESSFRSLLDYEDNQAPSQVQNLINSGDESEVELTWDASSDASGLARYKIYRNEELYNFTSATSFSDRGLSANEIYKYTVIAVDRSGNESPESEVVTIETPATLEKLKNGEFIDAKSSWELATFQGGEASFEVVNGAGLSGEESGKIVITNSTSLNWNIQLRQSLEIVPGSKYTIKFKAKASTDVSFITVIQQVNDPFTIYKQIQTDLTQDVNSYTASFTSKVSDFVFLSFFLGDIGNATVWVDSVTVAQELGEQRSDGEKILNGNFENGKEDWSFDIFNENINANLSIFEQGVYENDTNGGLINITSSSGTDWHIQLRQFFEVKKNHAYDVSFDAVTGNPITLNVYFQENREPYKFYSSESFEVSDFPKTYTATFEPGVNDIPTFTFFLGDIGETQVLIDNISVKERSVIVSNEVESDIPSTLKLNPAYPNPFNPITNLSFSLPEASKIQLVVYDMLGRKVKKIADGVLPAGLNTFKFDASNLSSGVYLIRLISGSNVQNQKITLLK